MRDDLIRITDPRYGRYLEHRHSGASHEAALQTLKCEEALEQHIRWNERQNKLMEMMTVE